MVKRWDSITFAAVSTRARLFKIVVVGIIRSHANEIQRQHSHTRQESARYRPAPPLQRMHPPSTLLCSHSQHNSAAILLSLPPPLIHGPRKF